MQDERMGRGSMEIMTLPQLKDIVIANEKTLKENQKEINANIKNYYKSPELPKEVRKRFEEKFGKTRTKIAMRNSIIAFALICFFLLFLQPSIFVRSTPNGLAISNMTNREVKNVTVQTFAGLFDPTQKPLFEKASLSARENISVELAGEGIYLVLAERQFPMLGIFAGGSAADANRKVNEGQNSTVNKELQQMAEGK